MDLQKLVQRPDWTVDHPAPAIDLSSNVNFDLILHEKVKELVSRCDNLFDYPNDYRVYKAISDYYKLSLDTLSIGLGSAEIIERTLRALNPDFLYIVSPTWGMVEPLCQMYNIPYKCISRAEIEKHADPSGTLYIANPCGQTGEVQSVKHLFSLFRYTLLDEAYSDWSPSYSCLHSHPDNVFVSKSISKSLCLAGLRVGFVHANERFTQKLQSIRPMYVTTRFAEVILPEVIWDQELVLDRLLYTKHKLEHQFECAPSSANFVRFKQPNQLTARFGSKLIAEAHKMAVADWTTISNAL